MDIYWRYILEPLIWKNLHNVGFMRLGLWSNVEHLHSPMSFFDQPGLQVQLWLSYQSSWHEAFKRHLPVSVLLLRVGLKQLSTFS